MNKPYVVSGDIYLLLRGWAVRNNFLLPRMDFFDRLREDFSVFMRRIFPGFEFIPEKELSHGLQFLVSESDLPVISLDRVYFQSEINLEITRLVDVAGNDRGLGHRSGSQPLLNQFRKLRSSGLREVVLVDDVIFTGMLINRVIELLLKLNISVPVICAGIGIAEGIHLVNNSKRKICCVRTYREVIDEICERDFYPGVLLSGRLVAGTKIETGAPYLLPFGKPYEWASIPKESEKEFSIFCLNQTIKLWEAIEKVSGKIVRCCGLVRLPLRISYSNKRFVIELEKILKLL